MSYRNDDVEALTARRDADELTRSRQELAGADRQLTEAARRARLPVLDNIRVASPCTMGWQNMTGDDRTRYCGQCKKDVYNLTGMTRVEAEALIVAKNGDLCIRYFQRFDGTIMLADCDIGAKKRRRLKLVAAGVAALLAGGAIAGAILVGRKDKGRLEAVYEMPPQSRLGDNVEGGYDREVVSPNHSKVGTEFLGGSAAPGR